MQNDFKPVDIFLGILAVSLGSAMRRDKPLVFQKANLGVGEIGILITKQVNNLADAEVISFGQAYSPVSMRSGLLS